MINTANKKDSQCKSPTTGTGCSTLFGMVHEFFGESFRLADNFKYIMEYRKNVTD
jgi:hypothetical protein